MIWGGNLMRVMREAEALAKNENDKAKVYVSTTYAGFSIIFGTIFLLFLIVNPFLSWSSILKAPLELEQQLSILAIFVVGFFFLRFALQLVTVLLMADQRTALSSVFDPASNLLALILTILVILFAKPTLLNLGIIIAAAPVVLLGVASIYFFTHDYKLYRPDFKFIDFKYFKDLANLGVRFFIIQITVVIIMSTNSIIITQIVGPEAVSHYGIANKYFGELSTELRKFIDKELIINADIVKNIDDPRNPEHQKVATEIFWRLQQGEQLNFMEVAHAKLSSLSRNFIVKYSDDETFDYENYIPIDNNPNKHAFFQIIERSNNRMQHLMLMTRFLLIEEADSYADLKDAAVVDFIEKYDVKDGIGNYSFENNEIAKNCIRNLNLFYDIFRDDPMFDEQTGIKELSREYIIISFYLLIRHIKKHYVIGDSEKTIINKFFFLFYERWASSDQNDFDIVVFSNNRQQSQNNLQERDIILRQIFFDYLIEQKLSLTTFDTKRLFNEAEKIKIYRRDKGICQQCLAEGKPEKEAIVSWTQYQADHIFPYAKGGQTVVDNGQVLCAYHNVRKSAHVPTS